MSGVRSRGRHALFVKDGNHAVRERVRRDLGDHQELVFRERTRSVLVEFHKTFLQSLDLGGRDWSRLERRFGKYRARGSSVRLRVSDDALERGKEGAESH